MALAKCYSALHCSRFMCGAASQMPKRLIRTLCVFDCVSHRTKTSKKTSGVVVPVLWLPLPMALVANLGEKPESGGD
eukprot:3341400-Amphidinium_carterae.1